MPGVGTEYARLPVTEIADDFSSEDEDDLYTRPPRRHKPKTARNGKPSLQTAPEAFRGESRTVADPPITALFHRPRPLPRAGDGRRVGRLGTLKELETEGAGHGKG